MKKIWQGEGRVSPYTPWSDERRRKARERRAMGPFWIGERARRAVEMAEAGKGYDEIAAALGATKNSVCGFMFRRRQKATPPPAVAAEIPAPTPLPAPAQTDIAPRKRHRHRPRRARGPFKVVEVITDPPKRRSIGTFETELAAQIEANKVWSENIDNSFRLIYAEGRLIAGVAWQPVYNEVWELAQKISLADR